LNPVVRKLYLFPNIKPNVLLVNVQCDQAHEGFGHSLLSSLFKDLVELDRSKDNASIVSVLSDEI
jgi:hypothetical protein